MCPINPILAAVFLAGEVSLRGWLEGSHSKDDPFLARYNMSSCVTRVRWMTVFLLCAIGKKLFGRSHTRAVAEKRREKIDEYCRVCYDNRHLGHIEILVVIAVDCSVGTSSDLEVAIMHLAQPVNCVLLLKLHKISANTCVRLL